MGDRRAVQRLPAFEDIVHQGSRIAALPSARGRSCVQPHRMCHRIVVLSVTVAAGGSRLWSPLVTASTSAAMNIQRNQAAAASRPLSSRSGELAHRSPPKWGGVELADSARSFAPTERSCLCSASSGGKGDAEWGSIGNNGEARATAWGQDDGPLMVVVRRSCLTS